MKKCPFCNFESDDRELQKSHLIKQHYAELIVILSNLNMEATKTKIRWVAGEVAFAKFENRRVSAPG